jgi:putative membrane protein insertion efficiency factor
MAFVPAWRLLMAEESSNVVERRAEPVSPFSEPQTARSPAATSRRLRPRVSAWAPQQRSADGGSFGAQPGFSEPVRLRSAQTRGQRGGAESGPAAVTRDLAPIATQRRLRRGHYGAPGRRSSLISESKDRITDTAASSEGAGYTEPAARASSLMARLALNALHGYQRHVSPSLGTLCRYEPTCSNYAAEAIERYGFVRGAWLALRRLSRCRPLGGSGFDPVT